MRSWVTLCLGACMGAIIIAGVAKFYFHLGG